MTGKLPPSASVALPAGDAKLHAAAAERNRDALCQLLRGHAPQTGHALEIASGTGQHIAAFATALPDLIWQPTEPDAARRASINAHVADAGLKNVLDAVALDATADGWHQTVAPQHLIFLANLLHLISTSSVQRVITESSAALTKGGTLILYGPFKRGGVLTSAGDIKFDTELRGADPSIGYKDTIDIAQWLGSAGLAAISAVEMSANNLAFIARKP